MTGQRPTDDDAAQELAAAPTTSTGRKPPIFVMSFNRPDYLAKVLESLRAQHDCDIATREVVLFQDGAVNRFSGRRASADDKIDESVAVFQQTVPDGRVMLSPDNIGIALNFDRAERYGFEVLGAEAVIFLEDDLVLGTHYIAILDSLVARFRDETRVGYVAAYGDHRKTIEQQRARRDAFDVLTHNWGFALFRRQWLRMRPRVLQYLQIVGGGDYSRRDKDRIQELFWSWGFGCPATSQDAAKTIACCMDGVVKLNTFACHAAYIGATGEHMNPEMFAQRGFGHTAVFDDAPEAFEPFTEKVYQAALREQRAWAGVPGHGGSPAARSLWPDPEVEASGELAEAVVTALYRALLKREPEPSALLAQAQSLGGEALPAGIRRLTEGMQGSAEFANKFTWRKLSEAWASEAKSDSSTDDAARPVMVEDMDAAIAAPEGYRREVAPSLFVLPTGERKQETMRLVMAPDEANLFAGFLRSARRYVEFGTGGSTLLAGKLVRESILSIDASREWLQAVADACERERCRTTPRLLHVDIGEVGEWGRPIDESRRLSWSDYHTKVWRLHEASHADFYLVDGRFRVACFMQILLRAADEHLVAIHDFAERPNYQVVHEVAEEVARARNLSIFRRREPFDRARAEAILAKHALDPG